MTVIRARLFYQHSPRPPRVHMPSKRPRKLIAFELDPQIEMPLTPAPSDREWMDQSGQRFAYRCLPLVIANQSGWVIACPSDVTVRWNGGADIADLKVKQPKLPKEVPSYVASHFGSGVLTFSLPYLFRTPRGVNLWVKGPANWIKDGIQPLEGVVETDWAASTFTMNWKETRRNHTVRFERGEPICMIVPMDRGLAESLQPICQPISSSPQTENAFAQWREARTKFNQGLAELQPEFVKRGWQRDYMLGKNSDGETFPEHQSALRLRPFRREH